MKLTLRHQIAVAGLALVLLTILASALAPHVFDAAKSAGWLTVAIVGYFAIGALLTAVIVYGVLRLGENA